MKKSVLLAFSVIFLYSCSLNYETQKEERIYLPDLYFENLTVSKIEDGKLKTKIFARSLEQYNKSKSSFAENAKFELYNDKKELEVQGSCGLLSASTDDEVYVMFNGIEINAYEQNLAVKAEALKWNNKTEQLSAPKEYSVTITNDIFVPENAVKSENASTSKMTVTGKKFSASGVTRRYSFGKNMHGKLQTETGEIEDDYSFDDFDGDNLSDDNLSGDNSDSESFNGENALSEEELRKTLEAFSNAGFSVELDNDEKE